MKVSETISTILAATDKSGRQIARELGHDKSWTSMVALHRASPQMATIADIAHIAGYRIDVVNDSTSEVLGTVEPPCIERLAEEEADGQGV